MKRSEDMSNMLCLCVSYLSRHCDKIADINDLEERFILAQGFRGFSLWEEHHGAGDVW
jgi:hypothetical protein